jgi:hypothetical protein
MKKHFALSIVCLAFTLCAFSQTTAKKEEGTLTKNVLSAIDGLSNLLADSCKHAVFIIEFRLNKQGSQVDSVRIVASDKRFTSLIDIQKLTKKPVIWPTLLGKLSLSTGTTVILPVLVMEEDDRCSKSGLTPQEVLDVFTHMQSYRGQLNQTAFVLNMMDIKLSRVSCSFAPARPIVSTAPPATTSTDDAN